MSRRAAATRWSSVLDDGIRTSAYTIIIIRLNNIFIRRWRVGGGDDRKKINYEKQRQNPANLLWGARANTSVILGRLATSESSCAVAVTVVAAADSPSVDGARSVGEPPPPPPSPPRSGSACECDVRACARARETMFIVSTVSGRAKRLYGTFALSYLSRGRLLRTDEVSSVCPL